MLTATDPGSRLTAGGAGFVIEVGTMGADALDDLAHRPLGLSAQSRTGAFMRFGPRRPGAAG